MIILKDTNIVIVEAESVARFGLLSLINKEPKLRVCGEAHCLAGARELCEKHQPQVVVFDIAVGDGLGFIKDLPLWSPQTRVVVHTGALEVVLIQRAFKAGAFGYVSRQDATGCLLSAIHGAVGGARHVSPRVEDVMLGNLATGALEMRGDGMPAVSNREAQTLRLLGKGLSNRQIADEMKVSIKTIETHCQRLKEKLHVHSSAALRQYAAVHGAGA
jgi:DNA-binding NarL/FixJ family response regulator